MSISIPLLNILQEAKIHFYWYQCLSGILIALVHALIALALLNSIKKLCRFFFFPIFGLKHSDLKGKKGGFFAQWSEVVLPTLLVVRPLKNRLFLCVFPCQAFKSPEGFFSRVNVAEQLKIYKVFWIPKINYRQFG